MISLATGDIDSVAVIGAHCDDILIGAGATLIEVGRHNPGVVIHALVLTGAGTEREVEEKEALAALCPQADVRLTIADLPDGRLPGHWDTVKRRLGAFARNCRTELVIGPQRGDYHQDHRLLAELIPTEFRDHLILGYEILKWETDLPNPSLYQPVPVEAAHRKVELLARCYPSQAHHQWFDDEAFTSLMRVRGVQCNTRYAEAFTVEKAKLALGEGIA